MNNNNIQTRERLNTARIMYALLHTKRQRFRTSVLELYIEVNKLQVAYHNSFLVFQRRSIFSTLFDVLFCRSVIIIYINGAVILVRLFARS